MASMEQRALVFANMRDLIRCAHGAAKKDGFATLMVGDSYAVITRDASLDDVLDGCLDQMVEHFLQEGAKASVRSHAQA